MQSPEPTSPITVDTISQHLLAEEAHISAGVVHAQAKTFFLNEWENNLGLSFSLLRILTSECPQMQVVSRYHQGRAGDVPSEDTISLVLGTYGNDQIPTSWLEINLAGKSLVVFPMAQLGKNTTHPFEIVESPIQATLEHRGIGEFDEKTHPNYRVAARVAGLKNGINNGCQCWDGSIYEYFTAFQDGSGFHQSTPFIESVRNKVNTQSNPFMRIERGRVALEDTLLLAWLWERERRERETSVEQFSSDLRGWNDYLAYAYELYNRKWKKYKVEPVRDFAARYTAGVFTAIASQRLNDSGRGFSSCPDGSYLQYITDQHYLEWNQKVIHPEDVVSHAVSGFTDSSKRAMDRESLLVHCMEEYALIKACRSGLVGDFSVGRVAMSRDRITHADRSHFVVWRLGDLIDIGYPLFEVKEDPRDSEVLQEVRSVGLPIASAVHIGRCVDIPDRERSFGAQIHHRDQYCGVEYLDSLRRSLQGS